MLDILSQQGRRKQNRTAAENIIPPDNIKQAGERFIEELNRLERKFAEEDELT